MTFTARVQGASIRSGLSFTRRALFVTGVLLCSFPSGMARQEEQPEQDAPESELRLKPTRNIQFETEVGTWLSLDVSSDGKTIVFELTGDLYTVPIEGGNATRITSGMEFDSQPSYSPDGQWIAYLSDKDGADNLWISKPDGSEPRKLSRETRHQFLSPTWTPDSQYVVVSKGTRGNTFWMYHVQGGTGVKLSTPTPTQPPSPRPSQPAGEKSRFGAQVSPDGRYLYFSRRNPGSVYNRMTFGWQVFRRDMISGDVDQITQAQSGAVRPILSPDGRKLVYGSRLEAQTGLRIRDLDSGQDRWLKYPVQRDDMESRGTRDLLPGYAFTPDGEEVVLSYDGRIRRVDVEDGTVVEVPFRARVDLEIGPRLNFQRRVDEGPVRSRLIHDPVQSPDGGRLAFSAMAHLYVKDLPQGAARRLTNFSEYEFKPAWSPDGKWIAFVTWDYNAGGHLWKVSSQGGTPQRLTSVAAFYTDPVFSPDGTRLVARRGNAWMRSRTPSEFGGLRIPLDLVWLPAPGGDATLIVPARGLGPPHFADSPDRIYFYSRAGLVSMRFDGTDRRTHLKVQGRDRPGSRFPTTASEVILSPDGQWALALVDNQMHVTAVPRPGGDAPMVKVFAAAVPVSRLTDLGADSFGWADGGKTVTWAVGSTFFRRPFDSISFDKPSKEKDKGEDETETDQPAERKDAKEEHTSVETFDVTLEFPRHTPRGTLVLRGATVIPMRGDAVLERADIVVKDNRIAAVGERGEVEIPSGARVLDMKGTYILPGFIDAHAHYEMRTEGVHELHNWSFLANLAYGVTSGLDVQTSTNDYLTYEDLVDAGMMLGPRALSTGPGVFSSNDFQSADAAFYVLEKYKKYYRNHNLKSYVVGNRKQRQWVAQAAQELGLTVTTEGALDLKLDMTHAIDGFGGNEHSLPIAPLFKDVVELFAQSKTAYTPTLLVLYGGPWAENYFYQTTEVHDDEKLNRFIPHNEIDRLSKRRPWFREDEHAFPLIAAQAAKIQRAGGLVGVGGHGQMQGLGFHWEMWAMAMGGMTPREVLKAATIDGAEIIGLRQDLGSLEVGKLADLVVLEKDPLEEIRNSTSIRYVMKNGELFEGDTLKQVWPTEKAPESFWWWHDAPAGK